MFNRKESSEKLTALEAEVSQLKAELANSNESTPTAEQAVATLEATHATALSEKDGEIATLTAAIATGDARISELTAQLAEANEATVTATAETEKAAEVTEDAVEKRAMTLAATVATAPVAETEEGNGVTAGSDSFEARRAQAKKDGKMSAFLKENAAEVRAMIG